MKKHNFYRTLCILIRQYFIFHQSVPLNFPKLSGPAQGPPPAPPSGPPITKKYSCITRYNTQWSGGYFSLVWYGETIVTICYYSFDLI